MQGIIDLIVNGIGQVWQTLENFEFLGTNMLKFSITILIIGSMLPVLLTLVQNFDSNAKGSYREAQREAKREARQKERTKG